MRIRADGLGEPDLPLTATFRLTDFMPQMPCLLGDQKSIGLQAGWEKRVQGGGADRNIKSGSGEFR